MDDIYNRVHNNIERLRDRITVQYDVRAQEEGFQVDKVVCRHNSQLCRSFSPKLQCSWEGPCQGMEIIYYAIYRIWKTPREKQKIETLKQKHSNRSVTS